MKAALRKLSGALAVLLFWTALWALLARLVGQELLLPSPLQVLRKLASMATTQSFWLTAGRSILRIDGYLFRLGSEGISPGLSLVN